MLTGLSRFLVLILLIALSFYGCNQQSKEVAITALTNTAEFSSSRAENKQDSSSFLEKIFEEAGQNYPSDFSEVPPVSIELLNYIAHQNGKTRICKGETYELLLNSFFPKLYALSSQEYLVEQLCASGYNFTYSYFIYRFHSPLSQSQTKLRSPKTYTRGQGGYFELKNDLNQQSEATVSGGDLILLSFDRFRIDESKKYAKVADDVISGRRIYDSDRRILSIFSKARGTADCGSFARYELENIKFKLLEYRNQECCLTQQECDNPNYRRSPDKYPQIYP